jgi:hypothetical protein
MSVPDTNSTHCVASAPPAYDVTMSSSTNATEGKTTQVRQRVFAPQPQASAPPQMPPLTAAVSREEQDKRFKNECCCLSCGCIMGLALGVLWGMNQFCDCSSLSGPSPNMQGRIPLGRPSP